MNLPNYTNNSGRLLFVNEKYQMKPTRTKMYSYFENSDPRKANI